MRLTIFGATGRMGRLLVEQALHEGYEVVAFARNPDRLRGVSQYRGQASLGSC